MNDIFFWQNRQAGTKYPYLVLLLVTVFAFGLGLYHYFTGEDAMIRWEKVPHLDVVDAFINQFQAGGQDFSIKANGYVLTERYDASLPYINITASKIFLGLLGLMLSYFLAVATTLKRVPYFVAMFLLMFFLVSCNLDGLSLLSETGNYALFAALLIFTLPSYAFHAFFPETGFSKRLLFFVALTAVSGFLIFQFSSLNSEATTLHLINHASIGCAVASAMFIMWVSYELIHGIVWLNTRAKTQAGRFGLMQFMLISLLYIGNLLLFFLEEAGIYRLGFVYLDAFIILFLSAIAGFWGLQKREEIYGRVLSFWPGAAFLFLVFSGITFLSIGYAFATANDSLIAAYKTFIIYTHLAYGAMFFLYVMINFGRLIGQKLAVYRVVYDPKKLPFYPVYIMGTILLAVLLLRTNANTYNQVQAGYFNYLGDLYKTTGETMLAERYFLESDVYEHHNVKANYSLAGLNRERNFRSREIVYLKEALLLRPNPKIFARLSSQFDEKQYFFEQQYTLKRGLKKFPESPQLLNNMGLLYNKTSLADSVVYFYNQAENFSQEKEVIQSNMLALLIKNALPKEAMQLAKETEQSGYIPLKSNSVLLQHLTGQETAKPQFPESNHTFTAPEFSLLYHSVLNRLHRNDTSAVSKLNRYAQKPENSAYADDFTLLKGALQHYNNQPAEAKSTLEFLSRNTATGTGYYQDIIGLWLLENHLYQAAAMYFAEARKNGFPEAPLHEAWALALAGQTDEARTALKVALSMENPELIRGANALQKLLNATPEQAQTFAAEEKIQFISVQPALNNTAFSSLINTIPDAELKATAENVVIRNLMSQNKPTEAQQMITAAAKNLAKGSKAQAERNRLQSLGWYKTNNLSALKSNLKSLEFPPETQHEKAFYQAVMAASENRMPEAKKLFDQVVKTMPYSEEALIAAANFYRSQQKDDVRAYEILMAGISYNPYSASLYQAYAFQSLRAGFEGYAQAAAERLQTLISPEEYLTFNRLYQARLAEHLKLAEGWE